MYIIEEYNSDCYEKSLIDFLQQCLPESGRCLELNGKHKIYCDIENHFEHFWCMRDGTVIIGTVAIKKLGDKNCELKSLYLLKRYHGRGLGNMLLSTAINQAKKEDFYRMYLDTLSTSKSAIALYKKRGFAVTERYNENQAADIFMALELSGC